MREGLYISLLFLIIQHAVAQSIGLTRYPEITGQLSSEFHEFFMAHDSSYFVVQSDFALYQFDGYELSKIDLPKVRSGRAEYFDKDYTLFGVLPDKLYRYHNGTFDHVKSTFKTDATVFTTNTLIRDTFIAVDNRNHIISYDERTNTLNIIDSLTIREDYNRLYFTKDRKLITYIRPDGHNVLYDNRTQEILYESNYDVILEHNQAFLVRDHNTYLWDGKGFDSMPRPLVFRGDSIKSGKIQLKSSGNIFQKASGKKLSFPYANYQQFHNGIDSDILSASHEGLMVMVPFVSYFTSDNTLMPTAIHTVAESKDSSIYVGSYGSGIYEYSQDLQQTKKYTCTGGCNKILPGNICLEDGGMVFFSEDHTYNIIRKRELIQRKLSKDFSTTGYFFDTLTHNRIGLGLFREGLGLTNSDLSEIKTIGRDKGQLFDHVQCLAQDRSGRIWYGQMSGGIGRYDDRLDKAITWGVESHNSGFGALTMEVDTTGSLWIGGRSGLHIIINPEQDFDENHSPFNIAEKIDLPNGEKTIVTFVKQIENYIVVGSLESVSFIPLDKFYDSKNSDYPIYQWIYGKDIEGGGSEQNCVLFDSQRRLWVCGQEGMNVIEWDEIQFDHTINEIMFTEVYCGGDSLDIASHLVDIPTDKRNIQIHFDILKNPSLRRNIYFDYYLIRGDKDTLTRELRSEKKYFEQAYLPPGDYTFTVQARKHGLVMDELSLSIHVPLSLSENPWFWSLLSGILVFGIGGFFYYRNVQEKNLAKEQLAVQQLKSEKEQLQVQTIISSFNPHFINNSLHWVQSRYRKDLELVRVVGRLSENIHTIFHNTRQNKAFHTLEEELKIVDNYIAIQKIRFSDSFRFERIIDDSININQINIFLLQIQIHVENAIEHGIRNRPASSYLKVTITESEDVVIIKIEDDGVGRLGAQKLMSRGTQSGVKMLNELRDIFNRKNENNIRQYYEDGIFTSGAGILYGTRVIIEIPKMYKYDE